MIRETTVFLFFLIVLDGAFSSIPFHWLGSSRVFADHYDAEYVESENSQCSKDGKITLDASRSSIPQSGTIWSNTDLISGLKAKKNIHVGLKADSGITTIINTPGSDGQLSETSTEFDTSKQTFTNLKHPDYSGGVYDCGNTGVCF